MGNEYDFEQDFKYNHDSQVSLTINLPKTCYSKCEFIEGNLYLKTKKYMQEKYLINPEVSVSLNELHREGQKEADFDTFDEKNKSKNTSSEEEINLFTYQVDISKYQGANLLKGLSIPFQFQIPQKCYPSCIFNSNTYIRHLLTFNFTSIKAKKTAIIIIKNDQYYSLENNLYKSPAIYSREETKHQYAILNKGTFVASIKLPKNSFNYDETIPLTVEIDCSNLNIQVKSIKIALNVTQIVKNSKNKKENKSLKIKELLSKVIPLTLGDKKYHIDDNIKFPITLDNPKIMYKRIDSDKRKFTEKFKNVFLFPSIYDDILICEYSIKVTIEMNTLFSTNEDLELPIEFYEDQKINNKDNYVSQLPSLEEIEQNKNLQKSLTHQNPYNNYINTENNINNQLPQFPSQSYGFYPDYNNSNLNNFNSENKKDNYNMKPTEGNNNNNSDTIEDSDAPPPNIG